MARTPEQHLARRVAKLERQLHIPPPKAASIEERVARCEEVTRAQAAGNRAEVTYLTADAARMDRVMGTAGNLPAISQEGTSVVMRATTRRQALAQQARPATSAEAERALAGARARYGAD